MSDELESMAERFGTPRRTLLTEARPQPAGASRRAAAVSLEIADAPCRVLLSTTGRLLRVDLGDEPGVPAPARRSKHDAIRSEIAGTTRGELGAVTDRGRLIRFSPVDLPAAPVHSVQLAAGVKVGDYLTLEKNERVIALVDFLGDLPIAVGTAQGVVKRVSPGAWPNRPDFELIALKSGDAVVGVGQGPDADELVFVTSDAQLLHFPAGSVRPQGVAAGGMAGIKLGGSARALFFGTVDPAASPVVVTVSANDGALPGTDPGRAKVSDFTEFPGKGRATGGVRSHAFLRGEAGLSLAWVGVEARAVGADGSQRILPVGGSRRDASGTPLQGVVHSIGTGIGTNAPMASAGIADESPIG